MTKKELQIEISHVQNVIATTKSVYLKKDYTKYLRKLKKQLLIVNNTKDVNAWTKTS